MKSRTFSRCLVHCVVVSEFNPRNVVDFQQGTPKKKKKQQKTGNTKGKQKENNKGATKSKNKKTEKAKGGEKTKQKKENGQPRWPQRPLAPLARISRSWWKAPTPRCWTSTLAPTPSLLGRKSEVGSRKSKPGRLIRAVGVFFFLVLVRISIWSRLGACLVLGFVFFVSSFGTNV